jgi:hypothetical protein
MRWIRRIRSMAPWVLGVFLLAQISCLIPGHYRHAGAASGHAMMHAASLGSEPAHHHALTDQGDECCAVHAMPLVSVASEVASPDLTARRRLPLPQRTLVCVRVTPLDPPPKLLSSV